LNEDLSKMIREEPTPLDRLQVLAEEASRLSLELDKPILQFEAGRKINRLMTRFAESPENPKLLETIEATIRILLTIVTELNVQTSQNVFFDINKKTYPQINQKAKEGDAAAQKWVEHFKNLGQYLGVSVQ
jgi:hypothetical protein